MNSVRAWTDYGFWNLGGFLNFEYDYTGPPQENLLLYKSHVSLYALPHYFAYSLAGERGYWLVVGWIPVLSALVIALSLAVIAFCSTASLVADSVPGRRFRGTPWVAGAAAFSIAFTSEPIWSMAWDTFDGSLSILLLIVSGAIAIGRGNRPLWNGLSTSFLLLSALVCGRFGILLAIVLMVVKLTTSGRRLRPGKKGMSLAAEEQPWLRWPVITATLLLGAVHYLRVFVYEKFLGFALHGQNPWYRLGFTHLFKEQGQADIDYQTPLSAFTFLWRQSEEAIGLLPPYMNSYHFLIWTFAVLSFAFLASRKRYFPEKSYWEVFLLLPLIWSLLLNQSTAEHPDLTAIFWLPAYVLGLSSALSWLYRFLCHRLRKAAALWWTASCLYLLFLWQIQYFLRAYPQLH
ncbi:hypothetical protein BBFGKLBO_00065 [Synechococcus sp. CBW1107]|nr:hypothetical protein BBFGKLBO_00065 [Synechococcus sp. CBW1107]